MRARPPSAPVARPCSRARGPKPAFVHHALVHHADLCSPPPLGRALAPLSSRCAADGITDLLNALPAIDISFMVCAERQQRAREQLRSQLRNSARGSSQAIAHRSARCAHHARPAADLTPRPNPPVPQAKLPEERDYETMALRVEACVERDEGCVGSSSFFNPPTANDH